MNEFSLATEVFESILEYSEAHEGRHVLEIRVELAQSMNIDVDQLKFCYDSIKQLTPLHESTLETSVVPGLVEGCDCVIQAVRFAEEPSPADLESCINKYERDSARQRATGQ